MQDKILAIAELFHCTKSIQLNVLKKHVDTALRCGRMSMLKRHNAENLLIVGHGCNPVMSKLFSLGLNMYKVIIDRKTWLRGVGIELEFIN